MTAVRVKLGLVSALSVAVALVFGVTGSAGQQSLGSAPGRTWVRVPDSRLDAVLPKPLPDIGYNSPEAITTAWNSGALDTKRNRLYVLGGGHADYSGNEVYQFDLKSLRWSRLTEPSPWSAVPHFSQSEPSADTYRDGRPASVHTYGTVQYLPGPDVLWMQGGSRWHDGKGSALSWALDLATSQWRPGPGASQHLGLSSGYDPGSNRVIVREVKHYYGWDVGAGKYVRVSASSDEAATYDGHSTAVHHAARMVVTIGQAVKNGGGILAFDLRKSPTAAAEFLTMTGDTEILKAYAPGIDYDSDRRVLVAWHGGGDVYEIDLAARHIRRVGAAGGTPPGPQLSNGTFGRWRYIPSEKGFIYVGAITEPVYFYKSPIAAAATGGSSASVGEASSRFQIPLRTWVARRLPGFGKGPTAGKHMRLAHNTVDGRIYFLGGDYSGPHGYDSGRNEVYSYSIPDDGWRLDYPYCGPAGTIQPMHPDEVGWMWDRSRRVFWLVPGYMSAAADDPCPERQVGGRIMIFDPSAKKWMLPKLTLKGGGESFKFAAYDAIRDQIIRFMYGGRGLEIQHFDIVKDRYETVAPGRTSNGVDVSDARVNEEYVALDLEGRRIFVIEPVQGRLFVYHIDKRSLEFLSETPIKNPRIRDAEKEAYPWDCAMPVWDSVNRVLLWPHIRDFSTARITLYVYDPAAKTWSKDTMRQPDGHPVRGNAAVFDPVHNALLVLGGTYPANDYLFLYRWGTGQTAAKPATVTQ